METNSVDKKGIDKTASEKASKRPEPVTGADEQQFDDNQDPALDKAAGQTVSGVQGGTVEQAGMRDSADSLNDLT